MNSTSANDVVLHICDAAPCAVCSRDLHHVDMGLKSSV